LMMIGGLLVLHSFLDLVQTGHTSEHWSRFIAMSFFWSTAFILIGTRLVAYVFTLLETQVTYLRNNARSAMTPSAREYDESFHYGLQRIDRF